MHSLLTNSRKETKNGAAKPDRMKLTSYHCKCRVFAYDPIFWTRVAISSWNTFPGTAEASISMAAGWGSSKGSQAVAWNSVGLDYCLTRKVKNRRCLRLVGCQPLAFHCLLASLSLSFFLLSVCLFGCAPEFQKWSMKFDLRRLKLERGEGRVCVCVCAILNVVELN